MPVPHLRARRVLPCGSIIAGAIIVALVLGACGGTAVPTGTAGSTASPARDAGWVADLERLVSAREEFHPDPWHGIARDEYVGAVRSVTERVPELTDAQLLVETVRLAAMPTWAGRDGHGGIHPWGEGEHDAHLYPLRLYAFADGIFVVDALPPYRDLIGDELTHIGGHPAADVLAAVEPLVPRDNHMQVLSHGPRLMVTAEILAGLGLIDDPALPLPFAFEGGGQLPVAPVPMTAYERWAGGHFTLTLPPRPAGAAWLSRLEEASWFEWRPDTGTLYIQYNVVMGRMPSAIDEVERRLTEGDLERIIVDVRHNGGGDNTTYAGFVRVLTTADASGVPVYLVVGRQTFSAAGNFVTELEQTTGAILVGEDLGASPNQYGDAITVPLEHSGLIFRVAPRWMVASDPDDPRVTIEPDIRIELTSDDYFGDADPVLDAILRDS